MNSLVSIIIPCYNGQASLNSCLKSIKGSIKNLPINYSAEIIVINDGSTDLTQKILQKEKNIRVIVHNKNLGLSSARNTGIKHSKGNFLVFLDCDIDVKENWLPNMLDFFNQNNDIVGVTGNLKPLAKKHLSRLEKYLFSNYRGSKKAGITHNLKYKWFVFSNTIIKKEVIGTAGPFDKSLKKYGGEDIELSIRISKKFPNGMRQNNNALSYHHVNKSFEDYLQNVYDYGKYNFIKIIKKHPIHKKSLEYRLVSSFYTPFLFNSLTLYIAKIFLKFSKHPLLTKFFLMDSFIKGIKKSSLK
ncbi:MAG: hypothetical protein CMG00_09295 [Candidatus Marinimicrobia bacterium]|nr:hypothetical protein [Candidatus Neomarinimicrobiota bacterium]|tara:strand:- start:3272 stop:4174 length:903 start_codon:yes stop_codon:yes gene_type:complete